VDLPSFLATHRRAFLVTRAAVGPTAHPMTLIPHDGTIYFNTYRKSAKARNLERDPRVACVATSIDDPAWVAVQGRAEITAADDVPAGLLAGRSSAAMDEDELVRVRARVASGKRAYVRVTPSTVTPGGGLGPVPAADEPDVRWEHTLRPSPIAMSAPEVDAFLRAHDVAALAWLDRDGWPHARLARYRGGPGSLVVGGTLAGDGLVCVTVDEFPTYETIRGVMVHGAGRALAGAVHVVPERVLSFDFRKISASGSGR
jgi:general stress protein 26